MRWPRAVGVLGLVVAAACARPAPLAQPRSQPRTPPPDSAAVLASAMQLARPAFATQEEALRAGIYRQPVPVARSQPAAAAPVVPPPGGGWVIQIAAFQERRQAESAAAEARRHFPAHPVVVESEGEIFRVALAGWGSAAAARAELGAVQRIYPGAWVRARGIS